MRCNEQWSVHDTTQPNTWQGAIHNHMVIIKIWIYNRISRVTWVSSVRRLQIWLKNFYRWSKKMIEVWRKWMGYEEQHYHEIDTQSITKHPWFNLQLELHKRQNDKVIKANLPKNVWIWKICLSPFRNENMSIELKMEPRIKQMMRYWARDRCVV